MRRIPMHMTEWLSKLDGFLKLNDRDILTHAGKISHEMALHKAEEEYDKFKAMEAARPRQVDQDFEKTAEQVAKLPKSKKDKGRKK